VSPPSTSFFGSSPPQADVASAIRVRCIVMVGGVDWDSHRMRFPGQSRPVGPCH
jgi:hypothetical protein